MKEKMLWTHQVVLYENTERTRKSDASQPREVRDDVVVVGLEGVKNILKLLGKLTLSSPQPPPPQPE